ncbi:ABC transporter permease, partial [Mesorhizobium sp. M8A.F.Ca.ET.213.01.1.1]
MSVAENQAAAGRGSAPAVAILSSIGRFLVIAVTTYLGLLAVTFFSGRVIPIDPVLAVLGDRAPTAGVERTRREMGLDLPLIEQFFIYVKSALSGDFGTSVLT